MKQKIDIRMLGCIIYIVNTAGAFSFLFILQHLTFQLTLLTALNTAVLVCYFKREMKILWNKLFNKDDDFRGGSFT